MACFTISSCDTVGLKHCATGREISRSIPGRVHWNLQVVYSFCPLSVAVGSTQPPTEMSRKSSLGFEERPSIGTYSCAVPVVPNVKVRMEARHSIPIWVLTTRDGKVLLLATATTIAICSPILQKSPDGRFWVFRYVERFSLGRLHEVWVLSLRNPG